MEMPAVFRRDHRGRFVSRGEARRNWVLSLRMAPARDAEHQLRRELASIARVTGEMDSPDLPMGFQAISVYGKRVPDQISAEAALALLARSARCA